MQPVVPTEIQWEYNLYSCTVQYTMSPFCCENVPWALGGSVVKLLPSLPLSSLPRPPSLVNQLRLHSCSSIVLPNGWRSPAVTQSGLVAHCNLSHQLFHFPPPPSTHPSAPSFPRACQSPSPPGRARCEGGFNFSLTDVTQAWNTSP